MDWQKHLAILNDVRLLDSEYKTTKNIESAIYVYAKTAEQAEAFNAMQTYLGFCSGIQSSGFYRYDEITDEYIEVESEIAKLQHIIDMLKEGMLQ